MKLIEMTESPILAYLRQREFSQADLEIEIARYKDSIYGLLMSFGFEAHDLAKVTPKDAYRWARLDAKILSLQIKKNLSDEEKIEELEKSQPGLLSLIEGENEKVRQQLINQEIKDRKIGIITVNLPIVPNETDPAGYRSFDGNTVLLADIVNRQEHRILENLSSRSQIPEANLDEIIEGLCFYLRKKIDTETWDEIKNRIKDKKSKSEHFGRLIEAFVIDMLLIQKERSRWRLVFPLVSLYEMSNYDVLYTGEWNNSESDSKIRSYGPLFDLVEEKKGWFRKSTVQRVVETSAVTELPQPLSISLPNNFVI